MAWKRRALPEKNQTFAHGQQQQQQKKRFGIPFARIQKTGFVGLLTFENKGL